MSHSDGDEVKKLQVLRLKLYRLDPPRSIRDLRSALAFIKERRIVLSTGRSSLPMLAEIIAGRHLHGSWMAHPEVYRIYELLKGINKRSDVLSLPLILGKDTIIQIARPAVARIADDPNRRATAIAVLPPLARRLLHDVERIGMVRMDRWADSVNKAREARLQLVRELLVYSRDFHTERGHHTAVVLPWSQSKLAKRFISRGKRLSYENAVDEVTIAAIHSAVISPEREVGRWFPFGRNRLDTMIQRGTLVRLSVGRQTWLAIGP